MTGKVVVLQGEGCRSSPLMRLTLVDGSRRRTLPPPIATSSATAYPSPSALFSGDLPASFTGHLSIKVELSARSTRTSIGAGNNAVYGVTPATPAAPNIPGYLAFLCVFRLFSSTTTTVSSTLVRRCAATTNASRTSSVLCGYGSKSRTLPAQDSPRTAQSSYPGLFSPGTSLFTTPNFAAALLGALIERTPSPGFTNNITGDAPFPFFLSPLTPFSLAFPSLSSLFHPIYTSNPFATPSTTRTPCPTSRRTPVRPAARGCTELLLSPLLPLLGLSMTDR